MIDAGLAVSKGSNRAIGIDQEFEHVTELVHGEDPLTDRHHLGAAAVEPATIAGDLHLRTAAAVEDIAALELGEALSRNRLGLELWKIAGPIVLGRYRPEYLAQQRVGTTVDGDDRSLPSLGKCHEQGHEAWHAAAVEEIPTPSPLA